MNQYYVEVEKYCISLKCVESETDILDYEHFKKLAPSNVTKGLVSLVTDKFEYTMLCDDDGYCKDLPVNDLVTLALANEARTKREEQYWLQHAIVGDVSFIARAVSTDPDMHYLTKEQGDYLVALLKDYKRIYDL